MNDRKKQQKEPWIAGVTNLHQRGVLGIFKDYGGQYPSDGSTSAGRMLSYSDTSNEALRFENEFGQSIALSTEFPTCSIDQSPKRQFVKLTVFRLYVDMLGIHEAVMSIYSRGQGESIRPG